MTHLFDPIELGHLTLSNRIIISPMCQYSADDGNASDWHMAHFSSLGLSGAGMFCIEATAVAPEGRITPRCLGLWNDDNERSLTDAMRVLRATSPIKVAVQLAHAGRKASSSLPWEGGNLLDIEHGGWQTIAPSAVPQIEGERPPLAMTHDDLARVKQDFVSAAKRAVRLGFDAIELHAAHGYLMHEFLSPVANQRTDEYGGSLENRIRFPLEVFEAMRQAVPDTVPVGIRISATDWFDAGPSWDLEQAIVLGHALKERGVDWIDASSGGVTPLQRIPVGPNYQVHLAEAIKKQVGVPTMAVGMITEPQQAQDILSNGQADMIALGRGILYDPRWPWHAAAALGAKMEGPKQYWRSLPSGTHRIFGDTTYGTR